MTVDGRHVRTARTVLRHRHAEPRRYGGDLRAPRSTGRPVSGQDILGYPDGEGEVELLRRRPVERPEFDVEPVLDAESVKNSGRSGDSTVDTTAAVHG